MSTTISTSHIQATIVASIAIVILEEASLDVQSWIGPRTMEVASRRQLGMMTSVVETMEDAVAMVVLEGALSISAQSIRMMVLSSPSLLVATLTTAMDKLAR